MMALLLLAVIIAIGLFFGAVGAGIVIAIAYCCARRRAKGLEQLREKVSQEEHITWSAPVRYSSSRRFMSWWKLALLDGYGLLYARQSELLFRRYSKLGRDVRFAVPRDGCQARWIGRRLWRNGAFFWFALSTDDQTRYFTSETGAWVFGSKRKTESIFAEVSKIMATYQTDGTDAA